MKISAAAIERRDFSQRLQQALKTQGYAPDSPTLLAREFNLRFTEKPVTVHAARKWLVGEAIPTQEKLRLLAEWLEASLEWLRFGTEMHLKDDKESKKVSGLSAQEAEIMRTVKVLNREQRDLIHKVMLHMVKEK